MKYLFILIPVVIIIILIARNIRIVPQSTASIIENLGSYKVTWSAGLHFKIPFIERIVNNISLKERVADFPPQAVITKDNVTIKIDTVVYYQVTDPKLYTYGVENPIAAIENLSATTLRNVIGNMELDETLTSRDKINTGLRIALDEATDPWGIKVNRVELKNILPPSEIQSAMEKQMKAEREKRAQILEAEGNKQANITEAEGYKASQILKAQGEKEMAILNAEARKRSIELEADAKAQAIKIVKAAEAEGIAMINQSKPSAEALTLRGYEALGNVANGSSNTLIVPSELASITSTLSALKATLKSEPETKKGTEKIK